jgi:hypothetical protein
MRIERINYQKVFPCGAYLTERIGFEASLEEGEDQRSAIEQMRQMAEDIHREKYPHYYEKKTVDTPHQEEPAIQLQEPVVEEDPELVGLPVEERRICMLIKGATTLQEVAKYKQHVPKHLTPRYLKRVKELSNS